tara:strand:- start:14392 stop:14844 length:453 start_codon:yes stop_codon:yes gene_type:complete
MSYIKFMENTPVTVTLTFDEPLENTNQYGKKQYTYGIKELITGEDRFSATEKLHEKIQGAGLTKDDVFIVEKIKQDDLNKGFAFFKISLPEVPVKRGKPSSTPAPQEPPAQATADIQIPDDATFKKIIWQDYINRTGDAGHKPGDDDLPF